MKYTELHLHGHNSLLDGLNTSAEYMVRAGELGMTHMALTDHGTNAGHREHQRAAKEAGIIPILGQEMYISETDRFDRRSKAKREDGTNVYNHLIVLAQNAKGLQNLNALSAIGWTEGFYFKPRIDMEVLEEHSEGLIVLSGCLSGLLAKAIERKDMQGAITHAKNFKRIFGDRFFIEVQDHNPLNINKGLMHISQIGNIKPVVTSDCHYAREEDLWLEEAMLILSTNPKQAKNFDYEKSKGMDFIERFNYAYPRKVNVAKPGEKAEWVDTKRMTFQDYGIFLKNAEQHMAGLEKHGIGQDAIDNTMLVAEMIEDDYPYFEGEKLLPKIEVKGETSAQTLTRMAWEGLKERGLDDKKEYRDRLQEELDIICPRFPEYFIIEADFVQWALAQGILVGPGRGSGAGSLVNYALRITNVDPIKFKLLFFRFINPERNDEPDIDTDFEKRRRGEVKDYVKRKYGHVASIANFNTFQGKSAVRDAARVFLVPLGDVNYALKGADWPSNMDFFEQWEPTDRAKEFKKKYPEAVTLAKFLYGRLKTQGMHAGGVVLSSQPISDYAPMQSSTDKNDESAARIPLVALDMNEAAAVGFIKYDMLGVKVLSTIGDTLALVKERHGVDIDLDTLPLDDPKVYATLSEGYTKGVFQCEAAPYTGLIIEMGGIKNFDELVASNALVRPGAKKSSAGAAFINRKEGREVVKYHHEDMRWFTDDTYGVVIYQEQVMLAMTELAGMKMGTADKVRKIIGKKKDVSEFEQYKAEFVDGASQKVTRKAAEGLWHDFEAHAGYSFNKSHAVAYSMLSYWTAWLKQNYPLEFMVSLLKNEEEKDSILDYLTEAKRMGIRILLPHVNHSGLDYEIQNLRGTDVIRMGLSDIKFISDKISGRILDQRPFENYEQLLEVSQTKGSGISSRVLESLNKIGGAEFPDNPRTGTERENYYEYLNIPAFEAKGIHPRIEAQLQMLDEFSEKETFVSMGMVRGVKTGPGWKRIDIVDETGSVGIFADTDSEIESGQLYVFLIASNSVARCVSVETLADGGGEDFREFLEATSFPDVPEGMWRVLSFRGRKTRKGESMADVVFCDEQKNLRSAIVWPSLFVPGRVKFKPGAVVDVMFKELEDGGFAVDKIL